MSESVEAPSTGHATLSASVPAVTPVRVSVADLMALTHLPESVKAEWNLDTEPMPSDVLTRWIRTFPEGAATRLRHLIRGMASNASNAEIAQTVSTFVHEHLHHPMLSDAGECHEIGKALLSQEGRKTILAALDAHIRREDASLATDAETLDLPTAFLERERTAIVLPVLKALIRDHFHNSPMPPEDRQMVFFEGNWTLPSQLMLSRSIGTMTVATSDRTHYDRLFEQQGFYKKSRLLLVHWNEPGKCDIDSTYFPGHIAYGGPWLATLPKQQALQAIDWLFDIALRPGGRLIVMQETRTPETPSLQHLYDSFSVKRARSIDPTDILHHLQQRGIPTADQQATLHVKTNLPGHGAYLPFIRALLGRRIPNDPEKINRYAQEIEDHGEFTHALTVLAATKKAASERKVATHVSSAMPGSPLPPLPQERLHSPTTRPPERTTLQPPFPPLTQEDKKNAKKLYETVLWVLDRNDNGANPAATDRLLPLVGLTHNEYNTLTQAGPFSRLQHAAEKGDMESEIFPDRRTVPAPEPRLGRAEEETPVEESEEPDEDEMEEEDTEEGDSSYATTLTPPASTTRHGAGPVDVSPVSHPYIRSKEAAREARMGTFSRLLEGRVVRTLATSIAPRLDRTPLSVEVSLHNVRSGKESGSIPLIRAAAEACGWDPHELAGCCYTEREWTAFTDAERRVLERKQQPISTEASASSELPADVLLNKLQWLKREMRSLRLAQQRLLNRRR